MPVSRFTHSRFVTPRFTEQLFSRPAVAGEPPAGLSFNMTAGDLAGIAQGYSNGSVVAAFGSIDAEPIPGNDLKLFIDGAGGGIAFDGDVMALVAGLTVWVDGVEYPFDGDDWATDGDQTQGTWASSAPVFLDAVSYFVEIK
jgi:hypothetical protein